MRDCGARNPWRAALSPGLPPGSMTSTMRFVDLTALVIICLTVAPAIFGHPKASAVEEERYCDSLQHGLDDEVHSICYNLEPPRANGQGDLEEAQFDAFTCEFQSLFTRFAHLSIRTWPF
eukprot:jgi/Mesvir1/29603/Mv21459-RA.1